ncbi:polysaccharide deacetylase family protein [Lujinxingia litoralis]|nr:polysaccharide deacetylase family protein [Lujinxingia litoralis]
MRAARFVISLDLELFWGVRDHRRLEDYRVELLGVRRAVPAMLKLFEEYGVMATWATVGMLFCESRDELLASLPRRIPAYRDASLSPYPHIASIGRDEVEDPFHFGLSLVRLIEASPGQEIASHTFSHYYCCEPGQGPAEFEADLEAAVAVAGRRGLRLRSLVFPRNQMRRDYLEICRRLGLEVYRGNPPGWLYRAHDRAQNTGMRRVARLIDSVAPLTGARCVSEGSPLARQPVDVPATRFFRPLATRSAWLARRQRVRICREIDEAVRRGGIYHLWWHPHNFGVGLEAHLSELQYILEHMARWRDAGQLVTATMAEAARQGISDQEGPWASAAW